MLFIPKIIVLSERIGLTTSRTPSCCIAFLMFLIVRQNSSFILHACFYLHWFHFLKINFKIAFMQEILTFEIIHILRNQLITIIHIYTKIRS